MRTGKEEILYTIITSKPPPSVPGVAVQLEKANRNGTEPIPLKTTIPVSAYPDPSQPLTYIIIYTFTMPRDVGEMTSIRFVFGLPSADWKSNDSLVYADIAIISGR